MSMNVFATRYVEDEKYGQVLRGVLHHKHWEEDLVADDADARIDRGESVFIPNPDFIEYAAMNMANDNVAAMLGQLGYKIGKDGYVDIAIDELQPAVLRALHGDAVDFEVPASTSVSAKGCQIVDMGIPRGYMGDRLARLHAIMATGLEHGATHVTFS